MPKRTTGPAIPLDLTHWPGWTVLPDTRAAGGKHGSTGCGRRLANTTGHRWSWEADGIRRSTPLRVSTSATAPRPDRPLTSQAADGDRTRHGGSAPAWGGTEERRAVQVDPLCRGERS